MASTSTFVIPGTIRKRSTGRYTAVLKDETGAVIPAASLTTMTLTLYVKANSSAIINNRNKQNVLNANNVTVDSSGNLVWSVQPADNAISGQVALTEWHRAVFEFTWASGAKRDWHAVELNVEEEPQVS